MVDTIKELRSSISKPNEENERPPQEESAAAGKGSEQKGPPFVTQEDVIAMLEKSRVEAKRIGSMFLSHHIHQAYSSSRILKAMRHQASFFSTKGKEARRSMSTVSLMLWDHMLRKEDPADFVRRFQNLALDCYDEKDEEALVEICISNIVVDYRVYLENIGIANFLNCWNQ
ncbi:unnamed protein product [Prunus armeniaca]